MTTTDTPRTDACPYCGADIAYYISYHDPSGRQFMCGSWSYHTKTERPYKCRYYEVQIRCEKAEVESESRRVSLVAMIHQNNQLQAEVERLKLWKDTLISNLMALGIYEHEHDNDPAVALACYGQ